MSHILRDYNLKMKPLTCENARRSSICAFFKGTSEIQRPTTARSISDVYVH